MRKHHPIRREYIAKIMPSEALRVDVRELVQQMRAQPESAAIKQQAITLLHEATETNLNFYLLRPAQHLNLHSIGLTVLNMGAKTVLGLIHSVGHKVAGRLSPEQMLYVADFVEQQILWQDLEEHQL